MPEQVNVQSCNAFLPWDDKFHRRKTSNRILSWPLQVCAKHERGETERERRDSTSNGRPAHLNHVQSFSCSLWITISHCHCHQPLPFLLPSAIAECWNQQFSHFCERYVGALKSRLTEVQEERGGILSWLWDQQCLQSSITPTIILNDHDHRHYNHFDQIRQKVKSWTLSWRRYHCFHKVPWKGSHFNQNTLM